MLKKVVLVLVVLLVLCGAGLGYAIYSADKLATYFKPQLESYASSLTGSKVALADLEVKLIPETAIKIGEVSLSRSKEESLNLKDFLLRINLSPLFSKKLEIVEARLGEPNFTVIKDENGVYLAGLPPAKRAPEAAPKKPAIEAAAAVRSEAKSQGLELKLQKLSLEDGNLTYADKIAGTQLRFADLDVEARVSMLDSGVNVPELEFGTTPENMPRVALEGRNITFDSASGDLNAPDLKISAGREEISAVLVYNIKSSSGNAELRSQMLDLARAAEAASKLRPDLAAYNLVGSAAPDLRVKIVSAAPQFTGRVGLSGVGLRAPGTAISEMGGEVAVSGDAKTQQLASEKLSLRYNGSPIVMAFIAKLALPAMTLERFDIDAFSGKVSGNAGLDGQRLACDVKLSGIDIAQAMPALAPGSGAKLSGRIESANASITGQLGSALKESLAGKVSLVLKEGRLEGQNLAASVLKGVTNLPWLQGSLYGPASGSEAVQKDATVIRSMSGSFTLGGARMRTSDLKLVSDVFDLEGEGSIGFDSSVDMNATIYFNPAFSAQLALKTKELNRILDKNGRLVLPLTLQGTPPSIIVVPNLKKLLEVGATNLLKDEAGKAIDRALGGKAPGGGKKLLENLFGF